MSDASELAPILGDYLLEQASVVMLVFGPDGALLQSSRFARDLLGDKDTAVFEDLFLDFPGTLSLTKLAAAGERTHLLSLNCADGSPRSMQFSFQPLDGGRVLALGQPNYGEMDKLRRTMESLYRDLGNTHRELAKRNQELALLNQLKNQFIGMAAHDLRSPISHISTCAQFLQEEAAEVLDPEQLELLKIISDSSRFMLELIDDILDISVIEAGKLNLDLRPVDLAALVRNNYRLNAMLAEQKGVRLLLDQTQEPCQVRADADKINQVLNNLLANAIKFTPGGSDVRVAMFTTARDAMVSVCDQGPGIDDDKVAQLFQPFSRLDRAPDQDVKGTGLGLAIASRIVLGHGGRIWVDSGPKRGAIFYFSLPLEAELKEEP